MKTILTKIAIPKGSNDAEAKIRITRSTFDDQGDEIES